MPIQDKWRYFELPLKGYRVTGFDFNPASYIRLAREGLVDSPNLLLSLEMEYELVLYGQQQSLKSLDQQGWKHLIDLWGKTIQKAAAYKTGDLFITFDQHCELIVRNGPYESWILYLESQKSTLSTWVLGGVGASSYFEKKVF